MNKGEVGIPSLERKGIKKFNLGCKKKSKCSRKGGIENEREKLKRKGCRVKREG